MARYIDADAYLHELEELIRARLDWTSDGKVEIQGLNVAICELENQPSADVVEVVRCKDCENWDTHWTQSTFKPNAHYCCVLDNAFDGDFFCACGERRKEWKS